MKNHWVCNTTESKNTYTNCRSLGGYFLLANEIITLALSPGERSVYTYLIFCEDRETYQCWPSIGRISQHTGMSANTVAKYIRQLEEKRLIHTEPTKVKTKAGLVHNGNLLYTIRPIQEAVNYKLERNLAVLLEKGQEEKAVKQNSALCGPVCGFGSRGRKRHRRSPRQALLEPCEPFVSSRCQRQLSRKNRTPQS